MKMNLSMEFLKPLAGTLKKYTALLPSVVITVVALLLFFPTALVGNKVKDQMQKSARTASTVQSLSKNVPSKNEPQQLRIYMDKLEEDANKIKQLAIQSSQRELVTYDYVIFPAPSDQSAQIFTIFGAKYRSDIESLIGKMNALDAPSDVEIRNAGGGGGTTPVNMMARGTRTVDAKDPMVDALCMKRAQEISVYTNPSGFSWYEFWEKYTFSGKDQALQDCWDSQVAFWIYEDIVDTIVKMNGDTGKVSSSPVKRLMGVSFIGPVTAGSSNPSTRYYGEMGGGSMGMRDIPNYVTPTLPSNFMAESPTVRVCNEEMDIIHFAVSVLVDGRSVLSFMKELCSEKPHSFYPSVFNEPFTRQGEPVDSRHNQITILNTNLSVVDKASAEHEFYRYGNGSVMRLDLICEYRFNRMGYDSIKPVPVKKRLGQFEETPENTSPGGYLGTDPGGMF
ncbi:MAG: hypothetical protein OEV87_05020 [Phycisphaerae bacterium]|nr:hypothetical protein [Phycisphaerae bacterium]